MKRLFCPDGERFWCRSNKKAAGILGVFQKVIPKLQGQRLPQNRILSYDAPPKLLRAAQHTLCPEAAAAGGMGIADAVFLVLFEQLAVSAVEAGSEFEIIKLSAEGSVFFGIPDIRQRLLLHIAEGAVGDLPADVVHIGIAVMQQSVPHICIPKCYCDVVICCRPPWHR